MQFCGYPLFHWDLVGCLGLNKKKKKKKISSSSLKGGYQAWSDLMDGGPKQ